jgi:hypothetical protein
MPQDLSANFQDSGLDYSLPPPPNADFSDDVNIFPAGPDSSTSGVTTSSSAPVRTPRSTSATSVARQGLKGLDDTSMEPPARIWRDGDDSLDLSSRGSRRPDAILGSISTNTPVVKLRGSKKNAPMTLREHEKACISHGSARCGVFNEYHSLTDIGGCNKGDIPIEDAHPLSRRATAISRQR